MAGSPLSIVMVCKICTDWSWSVLPLKKAGRRRLAVSLSLLGDLWYRAVECGVRYRRIVVERAAG